MLPLNSGKTANWERGNSTNYRRQVRKCAIWVFIDLKNRKLQVNLKFKYPMTKTTNLEFGISVIGICLIFVISNLGFTEQLD
jgi:hypothetical protein